MYVRHYSVFLFSVFFLFSRHRSWSVFFFFWARWWILDVRHVPLFVVIVFRLPLTFFWANEELPEQSSLLLECEGLIHSVNAKNASARGRFQTQTTTLRWTVHRRWCSSDTSLLLSSRLCDGFSQCAPVQTNAGSSGSTNPLENVPWSSSLASKSSSKSSQRWTGLGRLACL
jgi:hypothetical protein